MGFKRYLLAVLLISQLSLAMRSKENSIFIPNVMKGSALIRHKNGFLVIEDGKHHVVQKAFTDPMLRKMNDKQFKEFLKVGYVSLNKMSDNQFILKAKVRGLGGGPISGAIAYWFTKTLCYGTAVAATGTIVVATGGLAGGVVGGTIAATTASVSTGVTVVAGTIAGAGLTTEAALATTAVVTSAGSITGAIAAVETASAAVGAIFTAIPFLP